MASDYCTAKGQASSRGPWEREQIVYVTATLHMFTQQREVNCPMPMVLSEILESRLLVGTHAALYAYIDSIREAST